MLRKKVLLVLGILSVLAQNAVVSSNLITCATVIRVSGSYSEDGCVPVNGTGRLCFCSSLQAGLNFTSDQQDKNCTEIILSSGEQFSILRPVTINSSLVLRSSDPKSPALVTVGVDRTPQPPDYSPFYVLTVSDAELTVIDGVEFSGSSGIISILKVDKALVSDCVFR